MLKKPLLLATLLLAAFAAQAQSTPAATPAASTPAKKELATRIVKLQQATIEALARNLAEEPAAALQDRALAALPQRVPAERRDAVGQDIQNDLKKYVDEAVPIVQARAVALAPATLGALLESKFTEAELKQIATIIQTPAWVKFQASGEELQKALYEKLVEDTRPTIEPKVVALEESIARRLGVVTPRR